MKRFALLGLALCVLCSVISISIVGCTAKKQVAQQNEPAKTETAQKEVQVLALPPFTLDKAAPPPPSVATAAPATQSASLELQNRPAVIVSPGALPGDGSLGLEEVWRMRREAQGLPSAVPQPDGQLTQAQTSGGGPVVVNSGTLSLGDGPAPVGGSAGTSNFNLPASTSTPGAVVDGGGGGFGGGGGAGGGPVAGGTRGAGGGRGGRGGGGGGGAGGGGGRRGAGGAGGGGGGFTPYRGGAIVGNNGAIVAAGPQRSTITIQTTTQELWIISRPVRPVMAVAINDMPGSGALLARIPGRTEQVPVPLKHTDVKASIAGYIATVDVTQQYHNPYDSKIEAVYQFPLPQNAAVNEFLMTIGERQIRGIIRERAEAQQIYQQARAQGYVASLLTEERPNVFTQSVANIEPGKEIDIDIKYFHTLDYVDGWYEWVFPMVIGPRFNPPYTSDGVGAVGIGSRGASGQSTEVQYLNPSQRSGHDISLNVQIDAGVNIEQIESTNHQVIKRTPEAGVATVMLSPSDSIPNKDFVLRYKVAGETLKSAMMVQRDADGKGGYFTLMLVPPESLMKLPRQPLEMVFTLDVSGSMSGAPIEQSRAAIRYALTHMRPEDTFQIIRFANTTELMSPQPVPATPENVQRALQYIEIMQAGGGTMMLDGIMESLRAPGDEGHARYVAFLTDGLIGNEAQILGEIHKSLKDARIFSFGVGPSPNRYLLDHMAKMGAGAVAYLSLNDKADDVMSDYFDRISHPALSEIQVDFGGMQTSNVLPARVPDLFVGRPVIISGRFTGTGDTTVRVKGRLAGQVKEFTVPVKLDDASNQHKGVAFVWARMKMSELADQSTWDMATDFVAPIRQLALDYGLMSQFTSFVAVDSSARTAGSSGTTVTVPVPVPEGVRYDTTVQDGNRPILVRPAVPGGGG